MMSEINKNELNMNKIAELANSLYQQSKSSKLTYDQQLNLEDSAMQLAEIALQNGVGHLLEGEVYCTYCEHTGLV